MASFLFLICISSELLQASRTSCFCRCLSGMRWLVFTPRLFLLASLRGVVSSLHRSGISGALAIRLFVSLALARVCSAAAPSLLTHPLFDYVSPQPLFFNHRIAYANLEMMITLPTSSSCYAFCRSRCLRWSSTRVFFTTFVMRCSLLLV